MNRWDRVLLVVLILAYIPGTPGLGIDTRDQAAAPALLGYLYGAAFFAPIVSLAASWRWPLAAAWLMALSGAIAVVLPGLDLVGLLAGPPPAGMVALNAILVVLGAVVAWRGWRGTRSSAVAT